MSAPSSLSQRPGQRRPWQKPYNGFSWAERCAVTPVQNRAIREGQLMPHII